MAKKKAKIQRKVQNNIFKLHISLLGTKPLVWRRIMVPEYFSLEALHSVLQLTLGWQMSHLYDFVIDDRRYAEPDDFDETPVESLATSLTDAFQENKSLIYNYDFGDAWQHSILIEAKLPSDENFNYPICIGGENACPPEDCGSIDGFEELKLKVADPKHEDHLAMMRWLGGYFDPFSFDPNRINRDLLWNIDWRRKPNEQGLYLPFADSD